MGYKLCSPITCASPAEGAMENSTWYKAFITKKCAQCKTSHTSKIHILELLAYKNIGKLFSKYETFFLD